MNACEFCGKDFIFASKLLRHQYKKNPCSPSKQLVEKVQTYTEVESKFECEKCEKVLSCSKSLKRHQKTCKGVHVLKCPTCMKMFSSKQSKHEHMKNVKCSPPEDISEPHKNSVYLLIEREFLASKQNIFKIGRSANVSNRTRQYPKGSQLLVVLPCINSIVTECHLQRILSEKFTQRSDIGSEYYEGPPNDIIKEFIQNVTPHF